MGLGNSNVLGETSCELRKMFPKYDALHTILYTSLFLNILSTGGFCEKSTVLTCLKFMTTLNETFILCKSDA